MFLKERRLQQLALSTVTQNPSWNGANVLSICGRVLRLRIIIFVFVDKEGEKDPNRFEKVESGSHIVLEKANEYPDSMLTINDVKMEDRAEYMCYAKNNLGSSNSTVLVRVKGPHLRIWITLSKRSFEEPK